MKGYIISTRLYCYELDCFLIVQKTMSSIIIIFHRQNKSYCDNRFYVLFKNLPKDTTYISTHVIMFL